MYKRQVISSNKAGEVTATSLNNVGYLRVHVAPLQQAPVKVPANLTTPEAREMCIRERFPTVTSAPFSSRAELHPLPGILKAEALKECRCMATAPGRKRKVGSVNGPFAFPVYQPQ